MTKSKLNLLFPLLCLVLCLAFPSVCSEGVRRGLSLSVEAALPALYPALVLSSLLTRSIHSKGEKNFLTPFFLGLLCGFPVGASAVAGLVREGKISRSDGEKLLFFCNNAGPAFLISYCGGFLLGDERKGLLLFFLQSTISAICLLFFFGKRIFSKEKTKKETCISPPSLWKNIPAALRESANSFLYIISCIIFFSFFTELICHVFSLNGIGIFIFGIFTELCGGLEQIHHVSENLAFPLCALGCGWGGLSVQLQTAGVLEESGLSLRNHLLGKAFFAVLLFFAALFSQKLL